MKHLVLGSAGQIGEPLCEYIKQQGDDVITFDVVQAANEDLRINDNEYLDKCVSEADFVYFLAFDVGGSRYLEENQDKDWFIMNNLRLMCNTFKSLSEHSKPFLFASSQMADMKHSTYGGLKFIGEKMTKALGGTITRFWNVYGPERDLAKSHVITDFILKAKNNKKIDILTNGQETRQFLHTTDCSRCLYMISKNHNDFASSSLDITNFKWTTILDIANIVASLFGGVPVTVGTKEDLVQKLVDIPPDQFILDYWSPQISLEDGIKDVAKSIGAI